MNNGGVVPSSAIVFAFWLEIDGIIGLVLVVLSYNYIVMFLVQKKHVGAEQGQAQPSWS